MELILGDAYTSVGGGRPKKLVLLRNGQMPSDQFMMNNQRAGCGETLQSLPVSARPCEVQRLV